MIMCDDGDDDDNDDVYRFVRKRTHMGFGLMTPPSHIRRDRIESTGNCETQISMVREGKRTRKKYRQSHSP